MTKKPTWQELLNIPNILTYFRFLFIPVFIWQYLHENYWLAGLALGLSALTDLLDGKIARKFDMITEIGILLDPVADKLTEAAVLLCLALRFPLLWAVLAICLCKEGFMAVAGAVMLRRKKKLGGAMWFGKVCTAVLYAVLFAAGTIGLVAAVLAFALGVVGGIANNANQFMVSRSAPEAPDFSNGLYLTAANLGTTLGTSLCGMFITLEGTQSSVFGAVAFLVVGVLCVLWRLRCVGGMPVNAQSQPAATPTNAQSQLAATPTNAKI